MGEFFNDVLGFQTIVSPQTVKTPSDVGNDQPAEKQPEAEPQKTSANEPQKDTGGESGGKTETPKQRLFPTDVPEIKTKDQKDGLPVFDVDKDEFYQNMNHGRKRIRFKSGSPAAEYMRKTRYNKPFYIRHGEYMRKVK